MFQAFMSRLEQRPILSFSVILIALFVVIALSHTLRAPDTPAALPEPTVKSSRLFVTGTDESQMTVSARVRKTDTVDIIAVASGIVQSIAVRPGQSVVTGQIVATLTADYASGGAALGAERAALVASLTERTYTTEQEIIALEKKIAKPHEAKINRTEEVALKNLKIALERLKLDQQTAHIDAAIAARSAAALSPKALMPGTISHIAVRSGDLVSPGTVLMSLHASEGSSLLEAAFPKKIADALSVTGTAELLIDGTYYKLPAGYRAASETATGLVMVTYSLSHELSDLLAQHDYVTVLVPLAAEYRTGTIIPIDAIRSTAEETSVIIMDDQHITHLQTVTLGETLGASVIVKSGVSPGNAIVLDPSVLPGDTIEPIR